MAVVRTGTVGEIHTLANSGSQAITVPADATLVVVSCMGYVNYNLPFGTGTLTLGGDALTLGRTDRDTPADTDKSSVWYRVNPQTGSQTLAWNWGGSANWIDGGQIIYAFYTGVDTASPVRDSDGAYVEGVASTTNVSTPTLTALSDDMIFTVIYAYDDPGQVSSIAWTNATAVEGDLYNGSWGGAAESFPSGDVAITANPGGNSGNDLWVTMSSVVFRAAAAGGTAVPVFRHHLNMMAGNN